MAREDAAAQTVNILIVAQAGRLSYEAVLFAASLKARGGTGFRLIVAEPAPGPLWPEDPGVRQPEVRALLEDLGAEIRRFESLHFGAVYPYGNKIEALAVLPEGEPFVFFDTDTLVLDRLDKVLSISTAPRPRCGAREPGLRSSFTGRDTGRSGNRSTTGSGSISTAASTWHSRMNTGSVISTSTQGSSSTGARAFSGSAFWNTRSRCGTTRRRNWWARASIPGSTRLCCRC